MREEQPRRAGLNHQLFRRKPELASDVVVIPVHVRVARSLKALGQPGMRALRVAKTRHRIARKTTRQRLPDIAEQNHLLEVALEVVEEHEEAFVVVAEAVGPVAGPEVQIRNHRCAHLRIVSVTLHACNV